MKAYLISKGVDLTPGMSRDEYLSLKAMDDKRKRGI